MLLYELGGVVQAARLEPEVRGKIHGWINPELGFALRMLNVHMGSRFLT